MDLTLFEKELREMKLRNRTWTRVWENIMTKYNCDYVCELGVCKGVNFFEMIKHNPKVAVAVDSWKDDGILTRNDARYSQSDLDKQYEDFILNVSDKPFVKVLREYTFEAVKHFDDNFFDLIYVDADHSYEGCLQDINDWYPKVKKGKFLMGDDYRKVVGEGKHSGIKYGVIEAVNEFATKNNLHVFEMRRGGWALIKN